MVNIRGIPAIAMRLEGMIDIAFVKKCLDAINIIK